MGVARSQKGGYLKPIFWTFAKNAKALAHLSVLHHKYRKFSHFNVNCKCPSLAT
jgi:hypothetical protein